MMDDWHYSSSVRSTACVVDPAPKSEMTMIAISFHTCMVAELNGRVASLNELLKLLPNIVLL